MDKRFNALIKRLLSLFFVSAIASSCYYDNKEELYKNFEDPPCNPVGVTYDLDIQSIVDINCLICHSPGGQSPNLSTKSGLEANGMKVLDRINRGANDTKLMPPTGALSACDIEKIEIWYSSGTP